MISIIGEGKQKQLFMLTATPINNSFLDLQHQIELFTQRVDAYINKTYMKVIQAPMGIKPRLTTWMQLG